MININEKILESLYNSADKLSKEATLVIKDYLYSCLNKTGGFSDRTGVADPYYSVFGYTLAYIFEIEISVEKQFKFLEDWEKNNEIDLIHAASLIHCKLLLAAIDSKSKAKKLAKKLSKVNFIKNIVKKNIVTQISKENSGLLDIIKTYKSRDNGYNHVAKNADKGTVYAAFLVWSLFQDLDINKRELNDIIKSIESLENNNGSFVNENVSKTGVTSTTAAGLIMKLLDNKMDSGKTIIWIKKRQDMRGGFKAIDGNVPADLLSTATALTALNIANENTRISVSKTEDFINLHWDEPGGFFGSVADMTPDCEYTYYALLALGFCK